MPRAPPSAAGGARIGQVLRPRWHRLAARSHFPMFEVPGTMAAVIEDFLCNLS